MYLADIVVGIILDDDKENLEENRKLFEESNASNYYIENDIDFKLYEVVGLIGLKLDSMNLVDLPLVSIRKSVRYCEIVSYINRYFLRTKDGGSICCWLDYIMVDQSWINCMDNILLKYKSSGECEGLHCNTISINLGCGFALELDLINKDARIVRFSDKSGLSPYFYFGIVISDVTKLMPSLFDSFAGIHKHKELVYIDADSGTVIVPKECKDIVINSKFVSTLVLPEVVDSVAFIDEQNMINHIAVSRNTGYKSLCNIIYGILSDYISEYSILDKVNYFMESCEYKELVKYLRESVEFKEIMKNIEVTVY